MGVLFAYSVEVDEEEASGHQDGSKPKEALHKRIVKEMMHSIDVAGSALSSVNAQIADQILHPETLRILMLVSWSLPTAGAPGWPSNSQL